MTGGWRPRDWPLRLRVFLFFALIAAAIVLFAVVALSIAAYRIVNGAPVVGTLVLLGGTGVFAAAGVVLWVWDKFDRNVAAALQAIAAALKTQAHTGRRVALERDPARHLGGLGPAIRDITNALTQARGGVAAAVAAATEAERTLVRRLEAVLQTLDQGVVICSLGHEILLFNRKALEILHVTGPLGLGRSLTSLVDERPLVEAVERLTALALERRATDAGPDPRPATLFVGACADDRTMVKGRLSLTLTADGAVPIGYAIAFEDVTAELAAGIRRDRLLHRAIDDMRRRVANLLAMGEALLAERRDDAELAATATRVFATERQRLADDLERLEHASVDLLASAWPLISTPADVLLDRVAEQARPGLDCRVEAEPVALECDPQSLGDLLGHLLGRLAERPGTPAPTLIARTDAIAAPSGIGTPTATVDIALQGEAPGLATLAGWLDQPLTPAGLGGGVTGNDVLFHHRTTLWPLTLADGRAALRLPLAVSPAHAPSPRGIAMRPEFHDFDLTAGLSTEQIDDRPLTSLTFVVFDTETTGLAPGEGDRIVSIAGVRVVNGRRLRGETFDRLVNPGRRIPAASTAVHRITEAMVADAPTLDRVLPEFAAFVDQAVLVAHNAAFDMAFVTRDPAGAVLAGRPVLDTVLLAAHVLGTDQPLTLDHLAKWFSVRLEDADRHTALGDAVAAADVLIALFPLLAAAGVATLRDAVEVSDLQEAIRRRQRY